jgi:hypothetical protein
MVQYTGKKVYQMTTNFIKGPQNIPNGIKIFQIQILWQNFPFLGFPKYTQIGIFGL